MSKTASGLSRRALVSSRAEPVDASVAAYWTPIIRRDLVQGVEGIIQAGRDLRKAKESCAHGEFGKLFDPNLPQYVGMSDGSARKFMAIGDHPVLANRSHVNDLPPSWGTLYELSQFEPEIVEALIADGTVRPDTQRKQLPKRREPGDPKPTPPLPPGTYTTIVADPPWPYDEGWPEFADKAGEDNRRLALPYQAMDLEAIRELEVVELAAPNSHLFLWTTNRYLRDAYDIAEAWGFEPSQVLVWCKPPHGIGPGGVFSNTAEFVIYARRGKPEHAERVDSTWWEWPRGCHSAKPAPFLELVERVCPSPYLEMFSRVPRDGWEAWGLEA